MLTVRDLTSWYDSAGTPSSGAIQAGLSPAGWRRLMWLIVHRVPDLRCSA